MKAIKIEKNRNLLTTVFLGFGIFALSFMGCDNNKKADKAETVASDAIDVHENNSTVAEYITFIGSDNKMTLDHAYTNEALLKLISATRAMAGETGFDIKGDLDKAKEYADEITKDPFETSHADNIRKSADILSGVLQNMQQAKYPSLEKEVSELKNAFAEINPDVLTLDQRDAVKSFFAKAADLLQKMN